MKFVIDWVEIFIVVGRIGRDAMVFSIFVS